MVNHQHKNSNFHVPYWHIIIAAKILLFFSSSAYAEINNTVNDIVMDNNLPHTEVVADKGENNYSLIKAMGRANIAIEKGNLTVAQMWLRQAFQLSRTLETRSDIARIYKKISTHNPWKWSAHAEITPTRNANDGSETSYFMLGGLPFALNEAEVKIPGYVANAGISLSYRVSDSKKHRSEILAEAAHHHVWLDVSESPQGEVKASDFNVTNITVGGRSSFLAFPDLGATEITGLVGVAWRGGDVFYHSKEFRVRQQLPINESDMVRPSISLRSNQRPNGDLNDSDIVLLSLEWIKSDKGNNGYSIDIFQDTVTSESVLIHSSALGIGGSWAMPEVGLIRPSAKIKYERRDFSKFGVAAGGRQDKSFFAEINLNFNRLSYYGFSPTVSVSYRDVNSTIDIFSRRETSISLSVMSDF